KLHQVDIRPPTEWRAANRGGNAGQKIFLGTNPPNGALITYSLKTKPDAKERVHITVTDKSGKVVRDMDGTKEVGVNRVTWDLKTRSLTALPRAGEPGGPEQTAASATAGGEVTEAATEAASEAGVPGGTAAAAAAAAGGGGFGAFNGAMRVDPGEYTVKVAVGKVELTKTVVVE